jgi:hypothetical protein
VRITAWYGWAAYREDTGALISAHPDPYKAKHAAANHEREHKVPCAYARVRIERHD